MSELTTMSVRVNWVAKNLKVSYKSTDKIVDILEKSSENLYLEYKLKIPISNMILMCNDEKFEWNNETLAEDNDFTILLNNTNEENNKIINEDLDKEIEEMRANGYEFKLEQKCIKRNGIVFEPDENELVGYDPIDVICDIKYKKQKTDE